MDEFADLLRVLKGPESDPLWVAVQPVSREDLLDGGLLPVARWFEPVPVRGGWN